MNKFKLYSAGLIPDRAMWQGLRLDPKWNERVSWTARWVMMEGLSEKELGPDGMKCIWQMDHEDIRLADGVIVYAAEGSPLRGALVECGIAIGMGKPVIVVGKNASYGSWQYHPAVGRVGDFPAALERVKLLSFGF